MIVILFAALPVSGGDRNDKIHDLMVAQGALEMWEQQLDMAKAENAKMGKQISNQILSEFTPSEEFKERFNAAFNKFMAKLTTPWTAEEIVSKWAEYYGSKFTDEEIDLLIKHYKSDIGKKDVAASKMALVEFSKYFQDEGKILLDSATKDYIADLKIISKECKCRKAK